MMRATHSNLYYCSWICKRIVMCYLCMARKDNCQIQNHNIITIIISNLGSISNAR